MVNTETPTDAPTERGEQLVLLHGASSNVAVFEALMAETAPRLTRRHEVMADLLARAERTGFDDALSRDLRQVLKNIAVGRPRLVVCTCTTLGGLAERLGAEIGLPVERIDRALAEVAIDSGGRILVLATTPATLRPTADLFQTVAADKGRGSLVTLHLIEGAWPLFCRGDLAGYYDAIATAAREMADTVDVLVLAQVSMSPAKALIDDLAIRVLASPEPGLARALERLGAAPT